MKTKNKQKKKKQNKQTNKTVQLQLTNLIKHIKTQKICFVLFFYLSSLFLQASSMSNQQR